MEAKEIEANLASGKTKDVMLRAFKIGGRIVVSSVNATDKQRDDTLNWKVLEIQHY